MTPLLPYSPHCFSGTFLQRVKRFSVAFEHQGETLWAHTNNSGSMMGLLRPGYPVWVSPASGQGRKLLYTLEMINIASPKLVLSSNNERKLLFAKAEEAPKHQWVGVNTMAPNKLLKAAFYAGRLPFAEGYTEFRAEAKYGDSRLDALLTGRNKRPLWVECKNVTMVEDGVAAFPDAVTERGQKHLKTMMDIVKNGERAAFFYCIQRGDALCFAPADYIDPVYARLFYASLDAGVEVWPFTVTTSFSGLDLGSLLPFAPLA